MRNRCRHWLRGLATALAALLLAPGAAGGADLVHGEGLLWAVSRADGTEAGHVFGTVHSDDPRVVDLPAPVERAFDEAQRYAFELDFREDVDARVAEAMFSPTAADLEADLSDSRWRTAREAAAARGLPERALGMIKPWALAITLALPPTEPGGALDRVLFERALAHQRPITGLETAGEQIEIFDALARERQLALLRGVLDLVADDGLEPMFERVIAAWLERDVAAIVAIGESNPMLPDPAANDALDERLVSARNRRMAERMAPLLDRGGAFVAVGALHLPGEDGILQLLEDAGYRVRRVY